MEYFGKFLSDYSWWYGNKTIDRGDYYVSPVLNLARVVNVTQAYIADLAYKLSEKPNLLEELKLSTLDNSFPQEQQQENAVLFDIDSFNKSIILSGLSFPQNLLSRFVSSLCIKPFVILSGLSGSGKTKLAQAFASWIRKGGGRAQ